MKMIVSLKQAVAPRWSWIQYNLKLYGKWNSVFFFIPNIVATKSLKVFGFCYHILKGLCLRLLHFLFRILVY